MIKNFKKDIQRWIRPEQIADPSEVTFIKTVKLLLHHMPLRAMFWFRLAQWCKQKRIPFIPGSLQRYLLIRFGLELSPGDDIGGGLYIAHPVGTVIRPRRMGENCTIIAAVTIGMRNEWRFPDIGDGVFIGAGARVLGDIRIGNDAVIGANAVVVKDIPDAGTAVGIPARLIKINGLPVNRSPQNGQSKIVNHKS